MSKKYLEDDELEKLLEEQYIKEAEIMEKALFSDEDFEDYEMTDEEVEASYKDFLKRVDKDASAENKEDTEHNVPEEKKKKRKVIPLPGKKKKEKRVHVARVAGIAALCVISVFAASMTGEANRKYVINSVRYWIGDDTRILVDNDETNDYPETTEQEAIEDIENTLGVEVPEFMYRPENFCLIYYEVDINSNTARLEYQYEQDYLVLYIAKENEKITSKIDSMHGNGQNVIKTICGDLEINIKEIKDEKDSKPSYMAQWEIEDTSYQFSGKTTKEIFYRLLKDLRY